MNDALDSTVAELENANVCDVRTLVAGADDLAGNLRHYRRHVYLRMAEEIRASASLGLRVEHQPLQHASREESLAVRRPAKDPDPASTKATAPTY